jgi:hypothetical protein
MWTKRRQSLFNSFDAQQVIDAMAEGNVDAVIGFPMGGFSTEYDYSDQNDMIAKSMKEHPAR